MKNLYTNTLVKILFILFISLILEGCSKDDVIDAKTKEVNKFIYDNMNLSYFWTDLMPSLSPNEYADSKAFFDELLYKQIDRWSFITEDVDELDNYFAGVRKEFGYSIRGFYFGSKKDRVIAYIEYVEPNSPADRAGLKRGNLIVKIDGGWVTEDNYGELFNADNLNIGLGTITEGKIYDLPPNVDVRAEEININPILKNVVFNIDGKKIGYLAYTGFINKYDTQLEAVFANFKSEGVSNLILDLRYNGGGAISTALLMANMICPASCVGKLQLRTAYNEHMTAYYENKFPDEKDELFNIYFKSNVNNLDLSDLYVLTTQGTASASEMVIYSLSPYMNVVQIGEQTHGKYYGSNTIKDVEKHKWAIQPIILRVENVDNSIDYSMGLLPDVTLDDNYSHELGTKEDVLTQVAIDQIVNGGKAQEILKSAVIREFNPADNLKKKMNPLKYEMYIDETGMAGANN